MNIGYNSNRGKWRKGFELVLSVGISLILVLAIVNMSREYEAQIKEEYQHKLNLTGSFIGEQVEEILGQNIRNLENFGSRLETTQGKYFEMWTYDARLILDQNPSFLFMEWIDSTMVIRRVEPMEGNREVVDMDISQFGFRKSEWLKSASDSSVNITDWVGLQQRGYAFLVDAPVYYNNSFQGTITAGMDFSGSFDKIMQGRGAYNLILRDNNGAVFYRSGEGDWDTAHSIVHKTTVPIPGEKDKEWQLALYPSTAFYQNDHAFNLRTAIIFGMVLSTLVGVVMFFVFKSARESRRIKSINAELSQLNQALDREKRKAEDASRIKTEFLSNMSHEIRTPLNAILGLISIMKLTDEGKEQRDKYLEMMQFSSKNLLALVNDILEIDKVESGTLELQFEAFSPVRVVGDLLNLYEEGFEKKGVELRRNLPLGSDVLVKSDPVKFGQIITNLVRNAYKFTQEGHVEVSLVEEKKDSKVHLKIGISDTGIGIPAKSLEHIFERFSQVESGLGRKYEGTGLGLAISRQIVDILGGTISVESEVGRGSVFKVELIMPVAVEAPSVAMPLELSNASHHKILVAEDNPMNVMVLTKLLEEFDLNTDVVSNGVEAISAALGHSYDLIFMDIHMPEMDGIAATQKLRKRGIQTPVVAVSANVTQKAHEDAKAAGIQGYLTKPFSREELLEILNKYLGNGNYKNQ